MFLMKNTYIISHLDSLNFLTLSSWAVGENKPFLAPLLLSDTLSDVPVSIYEPQAELCGCRHMKRKNLKDWREFSMRWI